MAAIGGIVPEATDPRIDSEKFQNTGESSYIHPQHRKTHDPNVSFEEYHYYALIARAEEGKIFWEVISPVPWQCRVLSRHVV